MNWLSRQSFLGSSSSAKLAAARVVIIGLSGGGSHVSQQLAHLGVGNFRLIDPDRIDTDGTNLHRVVGATFSDVAARTLKVDIASRLIRSVNPAAKVETIPSLWQETASELSDADAIISCVDSWRGRSELELQARRYHVPLIDIGMDVHEVGSGYSIQGQVAVSMPGTACFRCMHFIRDSYLDLEAKRYGRAETRSQIVWANGILASQAVSIFTRLITPWCTPNVGPLWMELDGNTLEVKPSNCLNYANVCTHFEGASQIGSPLPI